MRDRIPFLFAALLVAGLIAVVGVAAFSITNADEPQEEAVTDAVVSGRVASAVLAASVSTVPPSTQAGVIEALAPQSASEPSAESTTTVATVPESSSTSAPSETPDPTPAPDTTPPSLVITAPDDGDTVTSSVVEFTGTSEPGAVVTSGPFEADMQDNGDWSILLVVSPGYNGTVFTARDAAGNETSVRISVLYEKAPSPTTTKAPSTTSAPAPSSPTTTGAPPSNCPVSGSCSPQWPADAKATHPSDYWRSTVEQYWPSDRVECVLDLIQVESGGDPAARSSAGSYLGLMQHSQWAWNNRAKAIGLVDGNGLTAHPYNGAANIAAGAWLANNSSPWWRPWPPTSHIASCQALGAG